MNNNGEDDVEKCVNADLHIHGRYSAATSRNLTFENIARGALQKGVNLVGTGDCLHTAWLKEIREMEEVEEGTFQQHGIRFVLTTEVEDARRVHHLLIFPSTSSVDAFSEGIKGRKPDLEGDGRPHLDMTGEEIAQLAKDVDALVGPCHAFTPWTALYAYHDSLKSCYGDMASYVSFLELGLSADSSYGDRISELHRLTFFTNSDAHSPEPFRLAREFNRFNVKDGTFREIKKGIMREGGRGIEMNVGLPPQEGKYNESACTRCYAHYSLSDSKGARWKCVCGGRIKKGVKDRVEEIADLEIGKKPFHRPPYVHIIPLGEIIAKALGVSSPSTKKASEAWERLVRPFGSEVRVLMDEPLDNMAPHATREVLEAITAFREGRVKIIPGGGGKYGEVVLGSEESVECGGGEKAGQVNLERWF
ncbi:MAG: TIGR00375 family protein [Candidatus Thermoplasmatota archaeon]|nr:TIGR00375 family protein [Candidatus Thermoplasmatota archaeon]